MSAPLLEVSNLQAAYGEATAIWDVSFRVDRSELVAILGANGAGKTTTLRTVQGVLPQRAGKVVFDSLDIAGLPANRVVEAGITLVPEGRGLFSRMSIEENLELGAFTKRARRNLGKNREFVFQLFPVLKERRKQKAGVLSGGEQQMLAVGRGLMSEPRLLMLDEPSLGLAPMMVVKVFQTLGELKKEGLTILLVEQNVEASLEIADRAYLLENGRTILEGTADEFRGNPTIKESYLGL
ncbi:MAG: ABC transporter ATP-binding protein [Nitrososphaerota archaeon]|nr:ABC transporter ATP-binding protein [Nitrososphaerota archaeon]MDG6938943.1 ABC transporter ATP-binding protein [Nitrososphaerota archaeon]